MSFENHIIERDSDGNDSKQPTINPDAPRPGPFSTCDGNGNSGAYGDDEGIMPPDALDYYIRDGEGVVVISCTSSRYSHTWRPLARRVVAALNACYGYTTEDLERTSVVPVTNQPYRAGLRNIYRAITGNDCEEQYALGMATSAVSALLREREDLRIQVESQQCEVCEDRQRAVDQPRKGDCGYGFAIDPADLCSRESCGHRADFHSRYDHCKECQCRQFLLPGGGDVSQSPDSSPLAAPESDFSVEKAPKYTQNQPEPSSHQIQPYDRLPFGSPPIGSESVASRLAAIERQIGLNIADIGWLAERLDGLGLADLDQQMSEVLGRLEVAEQQTKANVADITERTEGLFKIHEAARKVMEAIADVVNDLKSRLELIEQLPIIIEGRKH